MKRKAERMIPWKPPGAYINSSSLFIFDLLICDDNFANLFYLKDNQFLSNEPPFFHACTNDPVVVNISHQNIQMNSKH